MAAGAVDVQQGVDDLATFILGGPASGFRGRDETFDLGPFPVVQVARVGVSCVHAQSSVQLLDRFLNTLQGGHGRRPRPWPQRRQAVQDDRRQAAAGDGRHGQAGNQGRRAVLCAELGITRQTLYRHVDPKGNLRPDGQKLLGTLKPTATQTA
jgi:hypothetical protein